MSVERLYTLEQAREALPRVRVLAERIVEANRQLQELAEGALNERRRPEQLVPRSYFKLLLALAACDRTLAEQGVMLKDRATGLLDFPALYGGRIVLLCWQVGESDIEYWHDLHAGYAGRRHVDDLPAEDQPS